MDLRKNTSYGLDVKAEYMRSQGILKLVIVNRGRMNVFVEQVKIHYSNPLMYVLLLVIIVAILGIASMLQTAESVLMFINSTLTFAAIIVGVIGRKIGTKEKKLNVRAVLGPGEPYSITVPLKKKPINIEIITNKGIYKAGVIVPQVKPRPAYLPSQRRR